MSSKTVRSLSTALSAVWLWLAIGILGSAPARADGMYFRSVTAEPAPVEATAQRAILWKREQVWEIHIQPVFSRGRGSGAWVVPFPVLPTVEPSSAELFDQLEMLTAPVFLSYCSGCGGSDGEPSGDEGDSEVVEAGAFVRVWQRGTVGDLDFTVLSTTDGDSAVDWLTSTGYEVSAEAETLLGELEGEEAYFFVGKLENTLDVEKPLQPVRFVLPGLYPPQYPLRLSSLGVAQDGWLELSLWVVFPPDEGFVVSSHDSASFVTTATTVEDFEHELEETLSESEGMMLLFSGNFTGEGRFEALDSGQLCHSGVGCVGFSELGLTPPEQWAVEIQEMRTSESWVYRYEGWLGLGSLSEPLSFRSVPTAELPSAEDFHVEFLGPCRDCGGEPVLRGCAVAESERAAGGSPWGAAVFLLSLLAGWLVLSARRAGRCREAT